MSARAGFGLSSNTLKRETAVQKPMMDAHQYNHQRIMRQLLELLFRPG